MGNVARARARPLNSALAPAQMSCARTEIWTDDYKRNMQYTLTMPVFVSLTHEMETERKRERIAESKKNTKHTIFQRWATVFVVLLHLLGILCTIHRCYTQSYVRSLSIVR